MNHEKHMQPQTQTKSLVSFRTLGLCIGLVALAVVAIAIFNIPANIVFLGAILLVCPLLHFWMMGGNHKH